MAVFTEPNVKFAAIGLIPTKLAWYIDWANLHVLVESKVTSRGETKIHNEASPLYSFNR